MQKEQSRIVELDGLRGISILLVLYAHAGATAKGILPAIPIDTGWMGVSVFFVISGYLISGLLLSEKDRKRSISLGSFYYRRVSRLAPAWAVFLTVVALLTFAKVYVLPIGNLWWAASYAMNWNPHLSWPTAHLWSLSVEEQFYLLWPPLVAYLRRSAITNIAIATVIVCPLIRLAFVLSSETTYFAFRYNLLFVADAIAWGALLALRPIKAQPWMSLVPILMCAAAAVHGRPRFNALLGETILYAGSAVYIAYAVQFSPRWLSVRVLTWVGTLSYSLYLWQQLFLDAYHHYWATQFPVNVLLAFFVGMVSYYLIERPAGRRFGVRCGTGRHCLIPVRAMGPLRRRLRTSRNGACGEATIPCAQRSTGSSDYRASPTSCPSLGAQYEGFQMTGNLDPT